MILWYNCIIACAARLFRSQYCTSFFEMIKKPLPNPSNPREKLQRHTRVRPYPRPAKLFWLFSKQFSRTPCTLLAHWRDIAQDLTHFPFLYQFFQKYPYYSVESSVPVVYYPGTTSSFDSFFFFSIIKNCPRLFALPTKQHAALRHHPSVCPRRWPWGFQQHGGYP